MWRQCLTLIDGLGTKGCEEGASGKRGRAVERQETLKLRNLIATLVATDLEVDVVAAIAVAAKCKLPECAAVNLSFDFAE